MNPHRISLFRYRIVCAMSHLIGDEYGLAFGENESDVYDYLIAADARGIERVEIHLVDELADILWPNVVRPD